MYRKLNQSDCNIQHPTSQNLKYLLHNRLYFSSFKDTNLIFYWKEKLYSNENNNFHYLIQDTNWLGLVFNSKDNAIILH